MVVLAGIRSGKGRVILVVALFNPAVAGAGFFVALVVGGEVLVWRAGGFAQTRQVRLADASALGSSTPQKTWTGLRHFRHLCAARVARAGNRQASPQQHFGIVKK